jgi:hypothetical protein
MTFLCVLDGAPLDQIAERTPKLWRARFCGAGGEIKRGERCPRSDASTAGECLVALIERPELRAQLHRIDLQHEILTLDFIWDDADSGQR